LGVDEASCAWTWATLGPLSQWIVKTLLDQLGAFLVMSVTFYFFFSSARSGVSESARLRRSSERALLLFTRVALTWLVVLIPIWAIDLGFTRLVSLLAAEGMSSTSRWLLFLARTGIVIAIASVLHARMAIYLPSAAYESMPRNLAACWRQTRGVSGRLIGIFVVISVLGEAGHFGIFFLAQGSSAYFSVVDAVSGFLNVRSDYMLRNLASSAASILTGVPGTLLEAAVSVVVFKRLMPAVEQTTADIFD
jgi:hypothetical protein